MRGKSFVLLLTFIGFFPIQARAASPVTWAYDATAAPPQAIDSKFQTVVAVIDTGVDINHTDLRNSIWINPGESGLDKNGRNKSSNGIDDDQNGFIDDVHGWNFVDQSNLVNDRHGHGTHIAGIIAGQGTFPKGVRGIAPQAKIMVLKYFDKSATSNAMEWTVQAIRYAVQNGAHIINYSGGGTSPSYHEQKALLEAYKKNILIVAAAGNEQSNSDFNKYYPAGYRLPNILSVTALDSGFKVVDTSNYGVQSVDLAGPGKNIFSTGPNNSYMVMTGTSQATAFATGVAALLYSVRPELRTPEAMIRHLGNTGIMERDLINKAKQASRVNALKSLLLRNRNTSLSNAEIIHPNGNRLTDTPLGESLRNIFDNTRRVFE